MMTSGVEPRIDEIKTGEKIRRKVGQVVEGQIDRATWGSVETFVNLQVEAMLRMQGRQESWLA